MGVYILKNGKTRTRVFECRECGCIWLATSQETYYMRQERELRAMCPTCFRETLYRRETEQKVRISMKDDVTRGEEAILYKASEKEEESM